LYLDEIKKLRSKLKNGEFETLGLGTAIILAAIAYIIGTVGAWAIYVWFFTATGGEFGAGIAMAWLVVWVIIAIILFIIGFFIGPF